jgi:hypothetical protein
MQIFFYFGGIQTNKESRQCIRSVAVALQSGANIISSSEYMQFSLNMPF